MHQKSIKKSYKNIFTYLVIFSLAILVVWSFHKLFLVSYDHWQEPTIFADSFILLDSGKDQSLLSWILAQHNEHRISFTKLITLLEVNFFKLSPGQSALFLNLLLVIFSCGIWVKINQKFFRKKNLKVITILSGIILILHPWQWRNFNWEFQPPWFFINALLLLSTYILIHPFKRDYKKIKYLTIFLIFIPWLATYSSGQGIALGIALSIASFIKEKKLGIKVGISTITTLYTYFILLDYVKPAHHLDISFDFIFFFAILFGGIWHGLFLLILISSIAFLIYRPKIDRELLAPLLLPTLFCLIFATMVTLSRSLMGINQAGRFEYTTHTLMLGLISILLLGIIAERNNNEGYFPFIGISTLLITFGGLPQTLIFNTEHPNFRGYTFLRMWKHMGEDKKKIKNNFLCMADSAAFKIKNINLDCEPSPHVADLGPDYFLNKLNIKPLGWHKLHAVSSLNQNKNQIYINYKIKNLLFLPTKNLKISGTAYAYSDLRGSERFFIVANYEKSRKKAVSYINNKLTNSNEKININKLDKSFETTIPLYLDGVPLKNIYIETRNTSTPLLNNQLIKKFL